MEPYSKSSISLCCENLVNPINHNAILLFSSDGSPISTVPKELLKEIFSIILSYTDSSLYCNVCRLSKSWSMAAKDSSFVQSVVKNIIERARVFGNSQWEQCGGEEIVKNEDMAEESKSLILFQNDIVKNSVFGKKLLHMLDAGDSGLFVRMPKDLNLENTGALVKLKLPGSGKNGYEVFFPPQKQEHAGGSYWLWSSTIQIMGSGGKDYPNQQIVTGEHGYQDSHAREVAALCFAEFSLSLSETFLCEDWYARCLDTRGSNQVVVGFGRSGLRVSRHYNDFYDYDDIAVLGLLRCRPAEVRS